MRSGASERRSKRRSRLSGRVGSVRGTARWTSWRTASPSASRAATRASPLPSTTSARRTSSGAGSAPARFSSTGAICAASSARTGRPARRVGERRSRPGELARLMLRLQAEGCHNINFVTPEHVVPQILEALPPAVEGGLRLPLVYNTSAYDSPHSIRLMEGVVDIYMPDFKLWDRERSRRYLLAPDYPEAAREAIGRMHEQVGVRAWQRETTAPRAARRPRPLWRPARRHAPRRPKGSGGGEPHEGPVATI